MKRTFIAVIAAAGAICAAQQASAAGFFDSFRLEFSGIMTDPQLEKDPLVYRPEFRHHGDYYLTPGYANPQIKTVCRETSFRGDDGRVIQRITCHDR